MNFNFDLPDFSPLKSTKGDPAWSYNYYEKARDAYKVALAPAVKATLSNTSKDCKKTLSTESFEPVIPEPEVQAESLR